jgi:hypothetical protein
MKELAITVCETALLRSQGGGSRSRKRRGSDCGGVSSLLGSGSGDEAERAEDCEELHVVRKMESED